MRISKTWERAGDVGSSTLEAARAASDRARSTAADGLARAGHAVEPSRRQRFHALRLLVVPVVVAVAAGIAAAVRALRSGSGSDASEPAETEAGATAAPTPSPAGANGAGQQGDRTGATTG